MFASVVDKSFDDLFFRNPEKYVHPSSILGPNVILEDGVKIGPFCVITGNVKIGTNTKIYSSVIIGSPAQDTGTQEPLGSIEIGKNCGIREFATIGASKYPNGKTSIGDNCYVMSYCHVAHDVTLEENVILINSVNLGGHVHIEKNAFLMANCAAHQFCRIGQFAALAPYSAIRQDLPPFGLYSGLPAKYYNLNIVALKRKGFSVQDINALKHVNKLFYQDKLLLADIKNLALQKTESTWADNIHVKTYLNFIENSKRGVSKKTAHEEPPFI